MNPEQRKDRARPRSTPDNARESARPQGRRGARGPLLIGAVVTAAAVGLVLPGWLSSPGPPAIHSAAPAAEGTTWPAPTAQLPPRDAGPSMRQLGIAEWLAGHAKDWRVARLAEVPEVLVIEFPDLREQGAAMNRIAAYLEKAGAPRDRILAPHELASFMARSGDNSQTFFQGHDYAAADLARYFAQAAGQGVHPTPQEARLRRTLEETGLLLPSGAPPPTAQALVTFTATQADDPTTPADEGIDALRRETVLRHEISHGRFHTQSAYRDHTLRFWREVCTEAEREIWRSFLAGLGYDSTNEILMANEAQAFLLHTPDTRAFSAPAMGMSEAQLDDMRVRFGYDPAGATGSVERGRKP